MSRPKVRTVWGMILVVGIGLVLDVSTAARAADPVPSSPTPVSERQLYVVATSHLDTQWRWTIQDTINEYIPATLRENFSYFEKYPGYTFSFEGAFRYQLAREYYPTEFERLREFIRTGRWKITGSWVDAVDSHLPAPESLIRQTLYGNGFFRREFGRTSRDVFLPDSFGFGYVLPTVAAHSGLFQFSTQKLTWGSSIKIPFDIGLWEGIDGSTLVAAINPGDYAASIKSNLTLDAATYAGIELQNDRSGFPLALRYFGTGDVGGSPDEASVRWLQESLRGPGPLTVRSVGADQLGRDILARSDEAALRRLPRYRGEFLMTAHGAGCYTSQAAMKRLNRKNELLADAAERAAVTAHWLGAAAYPMETLRAAWNRFLWHQFHDDLTGTSIPLAYAFSWNDEALSLNQFADVLEHSVGAVTRSLDTSGAGAALVVYNPLTLAREEAVEVDVALPGGPPPAVRVLGPDGQEVPAQVLAANGRKTRIVFLAQAAPLSFAVYKIRPARTPSSVDSALTVSAQKMENLRYRVQLDDQGDVASIYDKELGRELLRAPLRLELLHDEPAKWSAWEVDYSQLMAPPAAVVGGPATVRIKERGPARVALEVIRETSGSRFVQEIRLAGGTAGDRVEFSNEIDWKTKGTLLKAAFPFAATNRTATYDLGLGAVEREGNRPNLFEVTGQQFADLTDSSGTFGAAVLEDSRYGWDKPDANTLRLTLVHTPKVVPSWSWLNDQNSNDLGIHHVLFAVAGHLGDWRQGRIVERGHRLNQPLLAWQAPDHSGPLGRHFSLLELKGPDGGPAPVAVRALKRAEESDELVVRLTELYGRKAEGLTLHFARPIAAVREINGAEESLGPGTTGGAIPLPPLPFQLTGGDLQFDMSPFRPRTFALRLAPPTAPFAPPQAQPLPLPYNLDGISEDRRFADGDLDGAGHALAGELLPPTFESGGLPFQSGPRETGQPNVLIPRGQQIPLPSGDWNRLYLIAAALGGDRPVTFLVDGNRTTLGIQDWSQPVGQWNNRLVAGAFVEDPAQIAPAYFKTARIGWLGTHRHDRRGANEAYVYTQFFRYRIDIPPGSKILTLPDDPRVRILAVTVAHNENDMVEAAQPFFDTDRAAVVELEAPGPSFLQTIDVVLKSPHPGATIRYTLDGSDPAATSTAYHQPLHLDRTTTVKARAFVPDLDSKFMVQATFTRVEPRPAARTNNSRLVPGLNCQLFEGLWRQLPDFAPLPPKRRFSLATVGLPADRPAEQFGMVCQGFLSVPKDGIYTLMLRSDDGSQMLLGDELIVDNDGVHDKQDRRAAVPLAAGRHPITIRYFQHSYGAVLQFWAAGPDDLLHEVPAEMLFREP